jgi:hypothetical protein
LSRLAGYIDRGLGPVKDAQVAIQQYVDEIVEVSATLDPTGGDRDRRRARFETLRDRFEADGDPIRQQMAGVMRGFQPGLFLGGDEVDLPRDNLDLERWFRQPKGHERRIHGHRHAGVRIVQEGPTLVLALDAHLAHSEPFVARDLLPYRMAQPPRHQCEAIHRRKVMRKARSKNKRGILLAELERRYLASP